MMKSNYKVIFSTPALHDLCEAKQWYNTQQKGMGSRLVQDVKATVGMIKRNPECASIKFWNVRVIACKTFPYSIHYEAEDASKLIRIVSVFHFSRRPYWV